MNPDGSSSTSRVARASSTRVTPGCKRGFRLSAKSKTRLRLSADARLVKNIDTGKTVAILRQPFTERINDRLLAALMRLNAHQQPMAASGLSEPRLVIHRTHDGTYHIGLKCLSTVDGETTALSVPKPDPGTVLGYVVKCDRPDGWAAAVDFLVGLALAQHAPTEAAKARGLKMAVSHLGPHVVPARPLR